MSASRNRVHGGAYVVGHAREKIGLGPVGPFRHFQGVAQQLRTLLQLLLEYPLLGDIRDVNVDEEVHGIALYDVDAVPVELQPCVIVL